MLVLEDLHWADPETLAVVDYLGDALRAEPVALPGARAGPTGAADDLLDRLEPPRPGVPSCRVGRSRRDEVDRMVAACLGDVRARRPGSSDFVQRPQRRQPVPRRGAPRRAGRRRARCARDGGRWEITGPLTPTVPASLRDSIRRRLAGLDPTQPGACSARPPCSGRHFDWELLPGIAEVDGRAAVDALRAAVDEQLIEVDGDGFRFRHALTREAVLADLLPPERRDLAARAWPAIERANPGLPGPTLRARRRPGRGGRRAEPRRGHLVESARRALAAGALATAEATARRARHARGRRAPPVRSTPTSCSSTCSSRPASRRTRSRSGAALAQTGSTVGAPPARAGGPAASRLARPPSRPATAGPRAARRGDARPSPAPTPTRRWLARIDAVAAEVALDRVDLDDGEDLLARRADRAARGHRPARACSARRCSCSVA